MKTKIEHIVTQLKQQPELMSLNEVNQMVSNTPTVAPKSTIFKPVNFIIAMTILTSLSLIAYFILSTPTINTQPADKLLTNSNPNLKNELIVENEDENTTEENTLSIASNDGKTTIFAKSPNPKISQTTSSKPIILETFPVSETKALDTQIDKKNEDELQESITPKTIKDTSQLAILTQKVERHLDSMGFILLSDEQLQKFHIYRIQDHLFYSRGEDFNNYESLCFNVNISSASRNGNRTFLSADEAYDFYLVMGDNYYAKYSLEKSWEDKIPVACWASDLPSRVYVFYFPKSKNNLSKLTPTQLEKLTSLDPLVLANDSSFRNSHYVKDNTINQGWLTGNEKIEMFLPNPLQKINSDKKLKKKLKVRVSKKQFFYGKLFPLKSTTTFILAKNSTNIIASKKFFYQNRQKNTMPSFVLLVDNYSADISEISSTNLGVNNPEQYFISNQHKMVAVYMGKHFEEDVYFWYENHHRLFELITEQEKQRVINYLETMSKINLPEMRAKEQSPFSYHYAYWDYLSQQELSIPTVSLSPEYLQNLGIAAFDKHIEFTMPTDARTNVKFSLYKNGSFMDLTNDVAFVPKVLPSIVSDGMGKLQRIVVDTNKNLNYETLIPLLVKTNQRYTFSDKLYDHWHPDCIFWYEPTKEFLAQLPDSIAQQIRKEVLKSDALQHWTLAKPEVNFEEDTAICVYLPLCEDETVTISNFQLFPNPARNKVNVKIQAPEEVQQIEGYFTITSIYGVEIMRNQLNGKLQFEVNLPEVASGMYLFNIYTNSGDKLTRRILIR